MEYCSFFSFFFFFRTFLYIWAGQSFAKTFFCAPLAFFATFLPPHSQIPVFVSSKWSPAINMEYWGNGGTVDIY